MRSIFLFCLAIFSTIALMAAPQPQEAIIFTADLQGCAVTPKLFEFDGFGFRQLQHR